MVLFFESCFYLYCCCPDNVCWFAGSSHYTLTVKCETHCHNDTYARNA